MELGDFKKSSVTLEDFTKEKGEVSGATLGSKTTSGVSASLSLSSAEPNLDSFRHLRESLMTYEGRQDYALQESLAKNEEVQSLIRDMPELLLSDMSDEDKLATVDIVNGKAELMPFSTMDRLSNRAFVNDSGIHETETIAESRNAFGDMLTTVNNIKREQQAAFNDFRLRREEEKGENLLIKDLGELVVPFAEWIQINQINRDFTEGESTLLGNQRREIVDKIRNAPLDQKMQLTEQLIRLIEENDTVLLPDGNDLLAFDVLESAVIRNDYSNFERWFDNAVSVLDVIGVGGLVATGAKAATRGRTVMRATQSDVAPASPSQIVKDVNPEMARGMNKVVEEDATGEAAEALYGTSKVDALAKDHLPEVEIEPGVTPNKPIQSVPQFPEPEALRVVRTRDGESYLTEAEVIRDRERVIQRADDVSGYRLQPESTVIKTNEDGSTTFRFMFHPTDAGWKTAARAVEDAAFALRDFGVDANELVLKRRDFKGDWVDTDANELRGRAELRAEFQRKKKKIPENLRDIDYSVGIDYKHRFDPSNFEEMFDKMPVSRLNFLDRFMPLGIFKGARGSLTQHLIPPRDLLDSQHVVGPAAAAIDRSVRLKKLFVEQFEEFSNKYAKLPKQDQARMRDYINDANLEGIRLSVADLRARGFNSKHIDMLRQWRRANDAMYHATNADMGRSLRMTGYKVLTDGNENTLIAKPLKRGAVGPRTKWYDPTDGSIKDWSEAGFTKSLDDFYEEGGELVSLKTPIEVDGEWIDVAINYNSPNKSYTRTIREDETVMSYRDGYYPVMYDANFIIKKRMRDANGNEFMKAVGTAKTRKEADHATIRLNEDEGEELFFVEADRRSKTERANGFISGEAFDAATSAGLSFQKARGQRLFDAGNNLHKAGHTNLIDPLEAVANQIQVLSEKVSMRGYLETTRARIVDNYKNVVDFPKDKSGKALYPTDVSELSKSSKGTRKDLADARSMVNYVHQLERGFQNQIIDKGFKGLVNGLAEGLEGISLKGSGLVRDIGDIRPSSGLKGLAFKLYLAANPQRQIVIQSAQANQLTARFPEYMASGGLAKDLWKFQKARLGITNDPDALDMLKQIREAGITVAVDANNLVRAETLRLADLKTTDKIKTGLNSPIALAQKIGFDKGEQFVLITSWLAHRADAIKQGKKLNARTLEQIAGDARAYTWDMNKAGDMPYTGNELNVIFQFLQVPHKASFQPLFNRQLTKRQRLQLLGYNTAMYGIPSVVLPAGVIAYLTDTFGEDSETITILNDGMIDYMLNGLLTAATGEQQAIDFGDLKPTDIMGTATMATALLTTDLSTLVSESPSASLIMGNNPRMKNFATTVSKWVVPALDYDDPENQITYREVVKDGMKLFSGMSNAMKTSYAFKTGQKISSLGSITDDDVTTIEAAAQFFGFRTKTEEGTRQAKELIFKDSDFKADDVRIWYNELKRVLTMKGVTPQQMEFHQRVISEMWAAFEPWETKAQDSLLNFIEKDMAQGNYDFIYSLVQNAGGQSTDEVRKIVMQLPRSDIRTGLLNDLDLIDESQRNWSE